MKPKAASFFAYCSRFLVLLLDTKKRRFPWDRRRSTALMAPNLIRETTRNRMIFSP